MKPLSSQDLEILYQDLQEKIAFTPHFFEDSGILQKIPLEDFEKTALDREAF